MHVLLLALIPAHVLPSPTASRPPLHHASILSVEKRLERAATTNKIVSAPAATTNRISFERHGRLTNAERVGAVDRDRCACGCLASISEGGKKSKKTKIAGIKAG